MSLTKAGWIKIVTSERVSMAGIELLAQPVRWQTQSSRTFNFSSEVFVIEPALIHLTWSQMSPIQGLSVT